MSILSGLKGFCKGSIAYSSSMVVGTMAEASAEYIGNSKVDKIFDYIDTKKPIYRKKGFALYQDKRNGETIKLKGKTKKAARKSIKLGK